jgi:hypothetical protein
MNRLSLPQGHDARTTTQGTGSTRARQPWGGLRWPRGCGQQTSSSQTRRGLHDGSPAAPVLGTGQWQSKGRDHTCTEGRSSWGTGDVKGSVSIRLRLRRTTFLLIILGFRTKLSKDYGFTTPIEVAAVGAWLVVGERVGAWPQQEPL